MYGEEAPYVMEALISSGEAYQRRDRALRENCLKVGIFLIMALIPAGALIDYLIYRPFFSIFLKIRLAIAAVMLGMLILLFTSEGRRHFRLLSIAPPLIFNLGTVVMIFLSNGPFSPYYASLNLVIFALAVVMPWTFRETLIVSLSTLVLYLIACLFYIRFNVPLKGSGILYHHAFFLGLTGVICAVAGSYKSQIQLQEFLVQHGFRKHNQELWTTLRKLEKTESQRERLRALGTVAAEHLHEINSPLNFTVMALKVCRESAPDGDPTLNEALKDIDEGIKRIRKIVGDLRAFAIPDVKLNRESFSFESALDSALRLLSSELDGITVIRNVPDGLQIVGAKVQVIHVLMNLIQNAAQAIRTTQRTVHNGTVALPRIEISSEVKKSRVYVRVRDNGGGIPPDIISKVFNPFFTTRQGGEGLGLGLSISRSIIKEHDGDMTARSKPGEGTEIRFDLPLDQELPT